MAHCAILLGVHGAFQFCLPPPLSQLLIAEVEMGARSAILRVTPVLCHGQDFERSQAALPESSAGKQTNNTTSQTSVRVLPGPRRSNTFDASVLLSLVPIGEPGPLKGFGVAVADGSFNNPSRGVVAILIDMRNTL